MTSIQVQFLDIEISDLLPRKFPQNMEKQHEPILRYILKTIESQMWQVYVLVKFQPIALHL